MGRKAKSHSSGGSTLVVGHTYLSRPHALAERLAREGVEPTGAGAPARRQCLAIAVHGGEGEEGGIAPR